MRSLKTVLTLVLAILWLPVSAHCLVFESAATLEFLACCSHEEASTPDPEHRQKDCASDACAVVEGAQYKCSCQRVTVPALDNHVLFEFPAPLLTPLTRTAISNYSADDALARLPVAWQFSARAALPVRAPSFVS